jgi:glucokinase
MNYYLGIDWGGTYIKAGIVDNNGKLLAKEVLVSTKLRKCEIFIAKIKELTQKFKNYKISAVGVGAPGLIDIKRGYLFDLPNVPGWKNFAFKKTLEKAIRLPVFLENDANVFALAEACVGAAKGAKRVLFLTLGTGLGGALIYDGKIMEGDTSAGEVAHFPIVLEGGRQCGCGGKGCIETFTGSNYLLQKYGKLKKCPPPQEVKVIYERALLGEQEALKVWQDFSYALGMFLSGMINIFNPQRIVLGGGVSGAFDVFKPMLENVIAKQAMRPQLKGLKIVKAKIQEAGLIGAALYARDRSSAK